MTSKKAVHIKVKPGTYRQMWFVSWYWEATEEEILSGVWNRRNSRRFSNEEDARSFALSL